jgi:cationic peptide transport system ATP-binding protein
MKNTLFTVSGLEKKYKDKAHWLKKSKDVKIGPLDFDIYQGETLAIVGEAGSGKSTLARLLSGAEQPNSGTLKHEGEYINWDNASFFSNNIRMIFQDAQKSLNPNVKIGFQLEQPLLFNTTLNKKERKVKILQALRMVGLLPEHAEYFPHMFSGGQAQRIGIARALILDPKVVIIDEALAPLDPSLRAQVLNLLVDLQQKKQLTYILISHHISLIRYLSDRIIVMDKGEIVEQGPTESVFSSPQSPITHRLITALEQ